MSAAYMRAVCRRIRVARIRAGFDTVTAGAHRAGIPVPTAVCHEAPASGSWRAPKLAALVKYSRAYNVSLMWLATGRDE